MLNETFERYLKDFLESKDLELDKSSFEESSMDEAFADATYDFNEVTVTVYFNPQENSEAIQTYEKFCCTPSTYYNRENRDNKI